MGVLNKYYPPDFDPSQLPRGKRSQPSSTNASSISFTDASNNPLTPKEAFRRLSHTFHGRTPSKEKKQKQDNTTDQEQSSSSGTTIRNLRIREDAAKYLSNLSPNSAYYDPKSRSMADSSATPITFPTNISTNEVSTASEERRERLLKLALETIDLDKDPYFMKNHLGTMECHICSTIHNNEAQYLQHSQVSTIEQIQARPSLLFRFINIYIYISTFI